MNKNHIANIAQNFFNHPNILASKAFIKKEFLHIFRDIRTVMILVLMPLVQILLFGFALSSEVRNVRFALLDFANDSNTQKIISHLSQNPHFILSQNLIAQDFGNDFSRAFKSGDIDFLLVFPQDFSANLYSGIRPAQVQIILDASDANRASTISIFTSNIIQSAFASDIARSPNLDSAQNLNISSTMLFNPQGKSAPNFVPGLLGLVLMLICAMMTSISIVREKEQGSMEVLLISPLKPSLVIISKLIPYFLLSFGILVLTLIVCVFVINLEIVGSLILLMSFCLLYLFLALCIGLIEANVVSKQRASIALYANAINSTKGTLGAGYLSNIIAEFGAEKNAKILDSRGASGATISNGGASGATSANGINSATFSHSGANLGNLEILSLYAYNPHLDYKLYMIPALTVMVLTLLCGFLPAFNIIGEKQSGNIEQINVSPLPKSLFIISKIIPYWIMGIAVISVCFLLAFLVYGFASRGGYGSIFVFALVYILVVTGLGLVISNYSNTMQQAMFVSYFFILILILLSGLFTSIKSMPLWAEMLTLANPLRYFIESLRAIFLKGDSLLDTPFLWWNLCVLLCFGIALNLWAIVSYKKQS